ncbi:MAG TPA: HAD-IIIC family phosphatase [Trichocoleus sp.]|jgi:FkbH-like protein
MTNQITLISDFNITLLGQYLKRNRSNDEVFVEPFGQLFQSLLKHCHSEYIPSTVIIWSTIEGISPNAEKMLLDPRRSIQPALEDVHMLNEMIVQLSRVRKNVIVVSPFFRRRWGSNRLFNLRIDTGIGYLLKKSALLQAEAFSTLENVHLLDCDMWFNECNARAFSARRWYSSKVPLTATSMERAASDIDALMSSLEGRSKKLLILDLDNTLWGGVVGDVGWQHVLLGGNNMLGEAFLDFQEAILALKNQGIQLAIVSKNTEDVALDVFRMNPMMQLKLEDFATWRINWEDKAKNIVEIVKEINIGLDSVVFIDDDVYERQRIKDALNHIFVPDWPEDPCDYTRALNAISSFATPYLTEEDTRRSQMYHDQAKRLEDFRSMKSLDDWLATLDLNVTVSYVVSSNFERVVQLLNKTNQMNLTTRKLTALELQEWLSDERNHLFCFEVEDKFGAYGLVGLVGCSTESNHTRITDFVLSCRAMGKKIEEKMLEQAMAFAKEKRHSRITAEYRPTSRNRPCFDFFFAGCSSANPDITCTWEREVLSGLVVSN